ncbi:MAG: hypothetical protein GQ527_04715 [Bacteroidales bacterium]|nr:hypothetical protein [Bacteroidales bacterium]
MIKKILQSKKEITEALIERGEKQLFRLSVIIDVLYALIIYKLFTFMPNPEIDHFGREELSKVLSESYLNYTVIFIGLVLVILYWGMSNLQFGNLKRTNSTHSTLSILQVFSLMIYIYFVRLDAQFEGEVFLMQLQSAFLAIAGFLSVWSWHYSVKNNLVSDAPTKTEKDTMYIKFLPEPVVSLLTFPLAWFGPVIWTAGWLLLIPIGWLVKKFIPKILPVAEGDKNNNE